MFIYSFIYYVVLGDSGYKLKPFLMTPFRNPTDVYERLYNQKHTSTRNVVERCFGVLKNRFRCILGSRGLHYTPEKATQIINACCAVHNMCITYRCFDEALQHLEANIASEDDAYNANDPVETAAVAIRRNIAINL